LISLDRPFFDRSTFKMAEMVMKAKHKPLGSKLPWLDDLLDKMLMKKPANRPSIQELIRMFDQHAGTIAVSVIKSEGKLERNRSVQRIPEQVDPTAVIINNKHIKRLGRALETDRTTDRNRPVRPSSAVNP
jgi:serine/threonine protein kinase